jgi:homopolymeric O-antigen transport system permease protein
MRSRDLPATLPAPRLVDEHRKSMNTGMFRALWHYRGFVRASVWREFQARYRGSALGFLWNILQPLGTVVIFTVIFAQVMRARLPGVEDIYGYGIYLCSGLFAWNLFAEIVQRCLSVFVDNGNMLKKANFPKSSLPLIVVLSASLNFAIAFGIFLLFLLLTGRFPGFVVLTALPVVAILLLLAAGLGVFLGTLNVFLRDVGQAVNVGLSFWFWLTPIVYPVHALPEFARLWLSVNPLAPIVASLQQIFVNGKSPDWLALAPPTAAALVIAALAMATFRARAGEIVDEL